MILGSATLTKASLSDATVVNVDLSKAKLDNSNFSGASLKNVNAANSPSRVFDSVATYNQWTWFPNFTPPSAATLVESPLGDFDGDDILNARDIDLLERRIACRAELCWHSWPPDRMFRLERRYERRCDRPASVDRSEQDCVGRR